ncbi:hypothetical protein DV515_00015497 [Chloebia gouldiae]|uniref:Uncharacterized protein n=1 Tax=Chloebia gouldiae TaxID=44316 RepID=A0A3L8RVK8_CHLGU|nr:hypothetical protein DV515_00015497 [Chloebia gouldiae]
MVFPGPPDCPGPWWPCKAMRLECMEEDQDEIPQESGAAWAAFGIGQGFELSWAMVRRSSGLVISHKRSGSFLSFGNFGAMSDDSCSVLS